METRVGGVDGQVVQDLLETFLGGMETDKEEERAALGGRLETFLGGMETRPEQPQRQGGHLP